MEEVDDSSVNRKFGPKKTSRLTQDDFETTRNPMVSQVFADEHPSAIFSLDALLNKQNKHKSLPPPKYRTVERCRGAIQLLTESRGRVTSPNFGHGRVYPNKDTCTWQIFAREDQRIKAVFEYLDIEDSYGCQHDYVALYDGPTVHSPPLGRFCGSELPPMLVTSGHQLTIYFSSSESMEAAGFALTYYFQEGGKSSQKQAFPQVSSDVPENAVDLIDNSLRCDDRVVVVHGISGKIESPGYGYAQFLADDMCNWRIVAPSNRRIRITFQDFELATGPNGRCMHEYITIFDGPTDESPLLGKFCGHDLPPTIVSTGPIVFVRFASGAPGEPRAGLRAVFTTFDKPEPTEPATTVPTTTEAATTIFADTSIYKQGRFEGTGDISEFGLNPADERKCDGQLKILSQSEGSFWSPRYPASTYHSNDLCYWLVRAPDGYRIRFFFDDLAIESSPRCEIDNLTLFDGDRDSSPLIAFLCGYEVPNEPFTTSGNNLLARFISGDSKSLRRTGFRIHYRFVESSQFAVASKPETPKDYPPTQVTEQETRSHRPVTGNGCHGVKHLLTGDKGVVVSPNFGSGPYWSGDTCLWEVRTTPSKRIRLGFQVFKIHWSPDCSRDRLIIYDGSSVLSRILGTFCGSSLPLPVTSTINVLLLKFVSDPSPKTADDVGFMAIYGTIEYATLPPPPPSQAPTTTTTTVATTTTTTTTTTVLAPSAQQKIAEVACNGSVAVLTAISGVISSPKFADNVLPASAMCFWEIRAPPGKRIRLTFETFNLPLSDDCVGSHVALFIGSGSARPQIGRFCGDDLPEQTISPADRLFIRFVSGPYPIPGGFAARYVVLEGEETTTEKVTTVEANTEIPSTTTTTTPTFTTQKAQLKCNDKRKVLTESSGVITSPNFGYNQTYPNGDSVTFLFHFFKLKI